MMRVLCKKWSSVSADLPAGLQVSATIVSGAQICCTHIRIVLIIQNPNNSNSFQIMSNTTSDISNYLFFKAYIYCTHCFGVPSRNFDDLRWITIVKVGHSVPNDVISNTSSILHTVQKRRIVVNLRQEQGKDR